MADENNAGSVIGALVTDAPAKTPVPTKPHALRRQKTSAETTVAAATAAKAPSVNRKKSDEQVVETNPTPAKTPFADKSKMKVTAKNTATEQAVQAAGTSVPAIDEIADLIQLEEENKRLRKTLADKLRAENADLRKRLGLA
ncbi:SyrB-like regulator [Agrobacterium rhizogenes]|uniref:Putative transcriptional regulator syrB2 n=1 Tax=Rhizobium rhizogenes TaxID=359 RepID=A0A7S5DSX2_RHIRH|nr:SyrB-like regulator [Rhizobium rhizogenes]NTF59360.1 SyrB-like regulator [Rhizobium rhizogenes]NTF78945.1 SyrB-like regulator [Rhizobium rhizogenes]NTJ51586.1 SyrB-like regulator [Rhizobium rhizogenes]QCL10207.1 putative transcriptional regulator syrB2 [Rhizobium rhizogenes]